MGTYSLCESVKRNGVFFLGRRPYFRNNGVNHVYIDNHKSNENDVKHVQMTNEYRIKHCEFFLTLCYIKKISYLKSSVILSTADKFKLKQIWCALTLFSCENIHVLALGYKQLVTILAKIDDISK